jgi:FkbM family methyltransferase
MMTPRQTLREVYRRLPAFVRAPIDRYRANAGVRAFSAHGEDLLMLGWLEAAGVDPPDVTYLDIGASHAMKMSNSALAYERGGSGVLVEPDPDHCRELRRRRSRDIVIEAGAAFDERRSATLIRFEQSVFNTFSEEQAQSVVDWYKNRDPANSRMRDRIQAVLVPVMEIVAQHFSDRPCHILDIDAEGVDNAILASIRFDRFTPWLICIERPSVAMSAKLADAEYQLMAKTPHNSIFAHKRMRDLAGLI